MKLFRNQPSGFRRPPSSPLNLRRPFLILVATLLVALGASASAGLLAVSHLHRTLDQVVAVDIQRLLTVTHVRRLFRSDLLALNELGALNSGKESESLRENIAGLRRERGQRLGQLTRLGIPERENDLEVLIEQHRRGDTLKEQSPQPWESAIARILDTTETRLAAAIQRSDRQARIATLLVLVVSFLAGVFALALGGIVLQRVRLASAALWESEEQLRQSQKMESIGRLAGGVAHDFNNLLTAIKGYASLMLMNAPPGHPWRGNIEGIDTAADRAAALTKQLLAFSRKQVIAPRVTDLGGLVRTMEKLLVRIIGEDVRLDVDISRDLGKCLVDPSQVEQVIMNLAVNARQAMPNGGTVFIEVRNAVLDEGYVASHPEAAPGNYVRLTVADTGIGMSKEIQKRIFEPFFTTKPAGQGTGLGLSVVYGAVRQQGGTINLYSEEGIGTTFHVYWPQVAPGAETEPSPHPPPVESFGGTETILLVEDDPLVRAFTKTALSARGYKVFEAGSAEEAIRQVAGTGLHPHLLLTDVVLPGRNGPALASELRAQFPGLPVLFCSGYTGHLMKISGTLDPGADMLQKPYDADTVVRSVRRMLDESPRDTCPPRV